MSKSAYVIAEEGSPYVKIGVSKNPEQRVTNLQCGCPRPLQLEYTHESKIADEIEMAAQQALEDSQVSGEWFEVSVSKAISTIKSAATTLHSNSGNGAEPPEEQALRRGRSPGPARPANASGAVVLSISDIAYGLRCPRNVIYSWVRAGDLGTHKFGAHHKITESALAEKVGEELAAEVFRRSAEAREDE